METSNDSTNRIKRSAWISRSMELRDKLGKAPEAKSRGTLELMDSYYNFGKQDDEEQDEVEIIIEE